MLTSRIEGMLELIPIFSLDIGVDRVYSEIRNALEVVGRPSAPNDMLIAAQAVTYECVVVTDNVSEFNQVPDLSVENWLASKR